MADKLNVGIAGCGEIAYQTADALTNTTSGNVAAVFDVNSEATKEFAEKYDAKACASYGDMLKLDAVQTVYISTPHFLHAPMGMQAIEAGKDVVLEKPMATTMADAYKIKDVAEKAGKDLTIAFVCRYFANAQQARRLIAEGAIGDVIEVRINDVQFKKESYWKQGVSGKSRPTDWRHSKEKAGGGILIMNSIHNADLMRYITRREPIRVYAETGTFVQPVEVEDFAEVVIRLDNGGMAQISAATGAIGVMPGSVPMRIFGTKGQIALPSYWGETADVQIIKKGGEWETVSDKPVNCRREYFEDYVNTRLAGKPAPVTPLDGIRSLWMILAAYKAMEDQRPVTEEKF